MSDTIQPRNKTIFLEIHNPFVLIVKPVCSFKESLYFVSRHSTLLLMNKYSFLETSYLKHNVAAILFSSLYDIMSESTINKH